VESRDFPGLLSRLRLVSELDRSFAASENLRADERFDGERDSARLLVADDTAVSGRKDSSEELAGGCSIGPKRLLMKCV
jgi:hypothetical protein